MVIIHKPNWCGTIWTFSDLKRNTGGLIRKNTITAHANKREISRNAVLYHMWKHLGSQTDSFSRSLFPKKMGILKCLKNAFTQGTPYCLLGGSQSPGRGPRASANSPRWIVTLGRAGISVRWGPGVLSLLHLVLVEMLVQGVAAWGATNLWGLGNDPKNDPKWGV